LFTVRGWPIAECDACTHRFVAVRAEAGHVAEVYGDGYFRGGGAGYPDYLAEGDSLVEHGRLYGRILRSAGVAGRLLDVGSAAGFVLKGLTEKGFDGTGLEPNATMAAHARERLGLDVRCGTLETLGTDVGPFDVVTMVQVVAHFHDLFAAFAAAAAATRPGGAWLIETWDHRSLTARLLGRRWHEYSPPSVLNVFSRRSLERLCAGHGFVPIASGRPRKRISGAHVKSLCAHVYGRSTAWPVLRPLLGAVPDRWTLPYPSEDVFWMLFEHRAG
jgi:SAM-dependent methyltransferase